MVQVQPQYQANHAVYIRLSPFEGETISIHEQDTTTTMRFSKIFQRSAQVYCAPAHSIDGDVIEAAAILSNNAEYVRGLNCHFGDIPLFVNGKIEVVRIRNTPDLFIFFDRFYGKDNYWITCNGIPVRPQVDWITYSNGMKPNIKVHPRMRGGSAPTQKSFLDVIDDQYTWTKCELGPAVPTQRLQKQFRNKRKFELWTCEKQLYTDCTQQLQNFESNELDLNGILDRYLDQDITSLVEDLGMLLVQFMRAKTNTDRLLCLTVFCKLRSGKSLIFSAAELISDVFNDLVHPEMQADDLTQEWLDKITDFRGLLSNWETLKESTLVQKMMKVYKFAIAVGVFTAMGITIDKTTIAICKKEMGFDILGGSFVVALLDAIALIMQRALMFKQTGEWSSFFHGPKSYGAWYDMCMKLKRESQFLGDLEAVGTSYHEFVKDVKVAIEHGEAILKYGTITSGFEIKAVKVLLNDLKMIQSNIFTYSEAQKSRRPPFALLVHSGSSLAKSTFVDMLFKYMGQIWNLPATDEFKYPRNSADPFWSGWNSSKWFILLDDIAYINPNRPEPDASLMEMIQLVNDVPLVPNQASLDDKGKNPVRARAVIATTNIKHLNAHARFACPLAVQRRLPFVINLRPKQQFARSDSPEMIDPSKLPPITEDWPDFWHIEVERVIDAGSGFATHQFVKQFSEINDFLDWLRLTMEIYDEVQNKASLGCKAMTNFKVCLDCNRVKCICAEMQAYDHQIEIPPYVVLGDDYEVVEHEGALTFHSKYTFCEKDGYNYACSLTAYKDGIKIYSRTAPVNCVEHVERKKRMQAEERAEYADVLAEIIEIQAERTGGWIKRLFARALCSGIHLYARSRTVRNIVHSALEWKIVRKFAFAGIDAYSSTVYSQNRKMYVFMGELAKKAYLTPRWKWALAGIATVSALYSAYMIFKPSSKSEKKGRNVGEWKTMDDSEVEAKLESGEFIPWKQALKEESELLERRTLNTTFVEPELQGMRMSVVDNHFPTTERENVWKRDDYEVSKFDMTPLNVQYKNLDFDHLMRIVSKNTARIRISNGIRVREGSAFCVGGHLWLTNNHTFFDEGDLEVRLETENTLVGTTPNVVMKVRQHELFRDIEHDLVWFQVLCWETKRDLRPLIRKPTLNIKCRAAYTGYNKQRQIQVNTVDAVQLGEAYFEKYDTLIPAWSGYSKTLTVVGDCGMPLVSYGSPCVAILGIHALGNQQNQVWATAIDSFMVERAVMHFARPIVQCGVPRISAPSASKKLVALRQWSPLRWMTSGSVCTYGSYDEFRVTSRSKVRNTLLGKEILHERDWKVDAVAPELKDWRPWHHALNDITHQSHGAMDSLLVRECAKAYVEDVIAGLTEQDIDNLQVLSDNATVNGIAGVKFIDKMNFKSSMGEPYCKSKRGFLEGPVNQKQFVPEVQDRINHVLECYKAGRRACPVFSGQLKDEPRASKKVAEGKVRVFTGAPVDWSFVVRKYLLTTVKVIQENPFLFEASPGCAAQTLEWEQYFDFLTTFGDDRMVAGDYGKFDKKMGAMLILEAFWMLSQILKHAGWSDEDLMIIHCIGEDTAFSFVNFGGDLLQFFGSNPSGHPLTVIINCLVNALYMRYCFASLHPGSESISIKLRQFKKLVKLLTYGDDNVMNVSRDADWFNHTAIQTVLASVGVEYTMADKESESRPFINIAEVSYLKRSWRWDQDIGAIVCPLEEASIKKMLTVCIPSDEESPEFHMASVMVSAANEWFWYGKSTFERERAWLVDLANRHGITRELEIKKLPTWQELYDRFWKASEGIATNGSKGIITQARTAMLSN